MRLARPPVQALWQTGRCLPMGVLRYHRDMQNEFNAGRGYSPVFGSGSALLGWAVGIAAVQMLSGLPPLWPIVVTSAVLGVAAWYSVSSGGGVLRTTAAGFAVLGCALFAGLAWGVWRAELQLADALPAELAGRELLITGAVDSLPRLDQRGLRAAFAVERAQTPQGEPVKVPKRVLLYWRDDGADITRAVRPGDRWRVAVRLQAPHGHMNPGGFDLESWLFLQGLRATGNVRQDPPPERLPGSTGSWRTPVEALRAAVRERLSTELPDAPHAGVVIGLAIGDQSGIPDSAWQLFAATGVGHLVSVSGLHITMLAGLVGALAGSVWRRVPALVYRLPVRRARVLAGVIAAASYTLLAGAGVPAQRTLFMLLVTAWVLWRGHTVRPARVLLVALALVLAIDPWAVLSPGFWLSFAAVGILLFAAAAAWQDAVQPNAASGWRTMLTGWGMAQWAVTLGTLPIVLWYFQQFSLVSPLANAVAIPLVSALIAPLSVAAGLLPVPLSGWSAQAAHALLVPLMEFLSWLSGFSWSQWEQARPPLWAAVLGGVGAICLLLPSGVPGRRLGLLAMAPLLLPPSEGIADGEARISLLDVGQGQATLVRTRQHALLFDTGPASSSGSDAGARIVLPVLRTVGIENLDRVVVSHEDSDHAGGLASVLSGVDVRTWLSSIPPSHPLRAKAVPHQPCVAGDRWQWDGVDFQVLHPPAQAYLESWDSNARSCVLRIEAGGQRLLLTGDIEAADEMRLVREQPVAVMTDFLQAAHHGSASSSSEAFLTATQSQHVLIPVGHRNRYRHPHRDVVERFHQHRQQVWRTDLDGAIHVRLGAVAGITSERRERSRYWHGR